MGKREGHERMQELASFMLLIKDSIDSSIDCLTEIFLPF